MAKKIKKAEAVPREPEGNGILAFAEFVLLPVSGLKGKKEFVVSRERDGLEPLVYSDIKQMHEDYKSDIVGRDRHPSKVPYRAPALTFDCSSRPSCSRPPPPRL